MFKRGGWIGDSEFSAWSEQLWPQRDQPQTQGYVFNPQGAAQPMVNTNMPVQPQAPIAQQAPAAEQVKVDTEFKK